MIKTAFLRILSYHLLFLFKILKSVEVWTCVKMNSKRVLSEKMLAQNSIVYY